VTGPAHAAAEIDPVEGLDDLPATALPIALWRVQRSRPVGASTDLEVAGWRPEAIADLVTGAGLTLLPDSLVTRGDTVRLRAVRERTLADTVGEGMRLLVCGVNPSLFSADAGVGYARPGNRFWPAALTAGIVRADRDPLAAFEGGLGMTDFAKRATRTAAEVTRAEYATGFARVTRLVEWLRPGAVCFVGLSGWREVVDRRAVAGPQVEAVGGRPVYVMPSTSGLNARTPPAELVRHLEAAWALGGPPD
jgi:TDG/mug DNA glycosylase family protein